VIGNTSASEQINFLYSDFDFLIWRRYCDNGAQGKIYTLMQEFFEKIKYQNMND
jgi:hypothetical protein